MRRALERTFRFGSSVNQYYRGLLGADECSKSHCDLSRGVVADDQRGSVILHLRKPDPELFYKLAIPFADLVPREVSMTKPARLGVPGTGPYMIQSYEHSRVVLVRNPHFRQWSAAAQPSGYPDRIELTFNSQFGKQLTAVEQGKADLMQSLPASRLNEIKTRYAAQVHVFGRAQTAAIFLNTREPPFNNLAARQALNYAIDRSKIVAGYGGVEGAAVTCQILPAGMPGYRPYCPYTRNPTANGTWTGPDLARAHKLVAASGTRGQNVVVWTRTEAPLRRAAGNGGCSAQPKLGYPRVAETPVKRRLLPARSRTRAPRAGRLRRLVTGLPRRIQLSHALHLRRIPACEPEQRQHSRGSATSASIDAVSHALTQQTSAVRPASNEAWAAVDRVVTNLAPWVPIVNPRDAVVVSRRVGNVQCNTQWGVLLDQLWVK